MIFCGNKSIMLMENLQWIILPSRWGFEVWGWRGGRVGGLEGWRVGGGGLGRGCNAGNRFLLWIPGTEASHVRY